MSASDVFRRASALTRPAGEMPNSTGRDSVTHALGYFDGANFRRSFKRWTAVLPGNCALF